MSNIQVTQLNKFELQICCNICKLRMYWPLIQHLHWCVDICICVCSADTILTHTSSCLPPPLFHTVLELSLDFLEIQKIVEVRFLQKLLLRFHQNASIQKPVDEFFQIKSKYFHSSSNAVCSSPYLLLLSYTQRSGFVIHSIHIKMLYKQAIQPIRHTTASNLFLCGER